jgi:hypothetical protein
VLGKVACHLRFNLRKLGSFGLVRLGEHDLIRDGGLVEQLHRVRVVGLYSVARVDEQEHAFQLAASFEIIADQPRPRLGLRLRGPRIAVARHVDEIERAVLSEREEIKLARPSRGHRDPRETAAPGERVDQARLADIGAAREGYLGAAVFRQVGDARHALDEGARASEQRLASREIG